MPKYRNFAHDEIFPSDYTRALEEYLSSYSSVSLTVSDAVTVKVAANADNEEKGLGLEGLWRYNTADALAAHPGGAAGTYDVVAYTGPNSFTPGTPTGELDNTVYAFSLAVEPSGVVPSGAGVAATRKIGEVDWDGVKITAVRQTVAGQRSTAVLTPTQPIASVSALTVRGVANPTAPLAVIAAADNTGTALAFTVAGAAVLTVATTGVLQWSGATLGYSGGALTTTGAAAVTGTLAVGGATSLAGGGTSTTPATADNSTKIATTAYVQAQAYETAAAAAATFAPLASPALTGVPTAPTAAGGTNSTQLATTAFVVASFAPLASPSFTGAPLAPTPATADNSTKIATTAWVLAQGYAGPGTGGPPTGAAGGDLSGAYPNPGVAKLNGVPAASYALLASPALTGVPTAPTAAGGTNSTQLATTAFVAASFAPLASPALTGNPTATTQAAGDNSTRLATTAWVVAKGYALAGASAPPTGAAGGDLGGAYPNPSVLKLNGVAAASYALLADPALTGVPTAPTAVAGTSSTQLATTAFVATSFAPLANPAFTGTVSASGTHAMTVTNTSNAAGTWAIEAAQTNSAGGGSALTLAVGSSTTSSWQLFGQSGVTWTAGIRADGQFFSSDGLMHSTSDARLKRNVRNIEDPLAVIRALRPVGFDWRKEAPAGGGHAYGFIAQEAEAVVPHLVGRVKPYAHLEDHPETDEEYWTFGSGGLVPFLVGAVQGLDARLERLEAVASAG